MSAFFTHVLDLFFVAFLRISLDTFPYISRLGLEWCLVRCIRLRLVGMMTELDKIVGAVGMMTVVAGSFVEVLGKSFGIRLRPIGNRFLLRRR